MVIQDSKKPQILLAFAVGTFFALSFLTGCAHSSAGEVHYLTPQQAGLGQPMKPGVIPPGVKVNKPMPTSGTMTSKP